MIYENIERGIFLRRLNRFTAEVTVNDVVYKCHVRNTGRCTAVMANGSRVSLQRSSDPKRSTPYTLIAVDTKEYGWVNLDSLAPNKIAGEWLRENGFTSVRPEYSFGDSRIDFYAEKDGERWLVEVKGCTLASEGHGLFPDAPTKRGAKHLRELSNAVDSGFRTMIAFVIMLHGIDTVYPNTAVDPVFAEEYERASAAGVVTAFIRCECTHDSITLR